VIPQYISARQAESVIIQSSGTDISARNPAALLVTRNCKAGGLAGKHYALYEWLVSLSEDSSFSLTGGMNESSCQVSEVAFVHTGTFSHKWFDDNRL